MGFLLHWIIDVIDLMGIVSPPKDKNLLFRMGASSPHDQLDFGVFLSSGWLFRTSSQGFGAVFFFLVMVEYSFLLVYYFLQHSH